MTALSAKMLSPPLTLTPDLSVGVEAPETTKEFPALEGVLKAKVSEPTVSPYQVLLLQEAE